MEAVEEVVAVVEVEAMKAYSFEDERSVSHFYSGVDFIVLNMKLLVEARGTYTHRVFNILCYQLPSLTQAF